MRVNADLREPLLSLAPFVSNPSPNPSFTWPRIPVTLFSPLSLIFVTSESAIFGKHACRMVSVLGVGKCAWRLRESAI
jgi:hypothetical protein